MKDLSKLQVWELNLNEYEFSEDFEANVKRVFGIFTYQFAEKSISKTDISYQIKMELLGTVIQYNDGKIKVTVSEDSPLDYTLEELEEITINYITGGNE